MSILDRTDGARVRVDRPQMKQLLINLLQNALAAVDSREDVGSVELIARRRGDAVDLEVHDDGPGIPRLEQGRIFDLFYSTRKGGTGLGLAIVKRIAQSHAADLSVSSTPGQGTAISVSLPLDSGAAGRQGATGSIVESRAAT